MPVVITPDGAKVIRAMILSCGSAACKEAICRLDAVTELVTLEEVGTRGDGGWLMPVFERLKWYAEDEHVATFDANEVIRYFGGNLHIEIFKRSAHKTTFGKEFGSAIGLVTHVLLPLQEGRYVNGGHEVTFSETVAYNPEEEGTEFYHLGLVVRFPVTSNLVEEVLSTQRRHKDFMGAVAKITTPVALPKNYGDALTCTTDATRM